MRYSYKMKPICDKTFPWLVSRIPDLSRMTIFAAVSFQGSDRSQFYVAVFLLINIELEADCSGTCYLAASRIWMQFTNGHVFGLSILPIITVLYFCSSFKTDFVARFVATPLLSFGSWLWKYRRGFTGLFNHRTKSIWKRSYCNCCEGNHRAVSINLTKYGRLSCKKDTPEAGGDSF